MLRCRTVKEYKNPMIKIVTVEEMRAIERAGDVAGVSYAAMMDNAGRALADRILDRLVGAPSAQITILVGSGNNGGDALVAGRLIAQESPHQVRFYLYKPRADDDVNFSAVHDAGLVIQEAEQDPQFDTLREWIATSQLVVDGILGIGLTLPIKGKLAEFVQAAGDALTAARQMPAPTTYVTPDGPTVGSALTPIVIAVDCPSGLDCDTGQVDTLAIPADETVTFAAAKVGQVLFPGAGLCGTLHVANIGLPDQLPALDEVLPTMPTAPDIRVILPDLPADAHKGTFGKVMNVTGSLNYTGAAALAAEAAYRTGAGLVTVAAPQVITPVLATQVPEATWLLLPHDLGVIAEGAAPIVREALAGYNALLLGPGWGHEAATGAFLTALLDQSTGESRHHRIGFAPHTSPTETDPSPNAALPPMVIDADGLNLLSEREDWWTLLPENAVLTPHPGEMARLTGLTREEVNAQRLSLPVAKAAEWGCVVVLKGAFTVIAAPDGQLLVLPFAEPALATAGTGDVLAGTIVSLLAQGCDPFQAAVIGGYAHGLAGRLARAYAQTARSVTARDVLGALGDAFSLIEAAI